MTTEELTIEEARALAERWVESRGWTRARDAVKAAGERWSLDDEPPFALDTDETKTLLGWVRQYMERERADGQCSESVLVAEVFDALRWEADGTESEWWGGYERGKELVRVLCESAEALRDGAQQRPIVTIRVDDDQAAHRVATVLEEQGYEVIRDLGDGRATMAVAAASLATKHGLNDHERAVLEMVLDGRSSEEITAERGYGSRATVKFMLRSIYKKTATDSREDLLRLALGVSS